MSSNCLNQTILPSNIDVDFADLEAAKQFTPRLWTLKEIWENKSEEHVVPLIDGLLAKEEFVILTAPAKSNKTWLTMHLALSVATGGKFLNHFQTHKGRVLLCELELSVSRLRERFIKLIPDENILNEIIDTQLVILKERYQFDDKKPDTLIELQQIITLLKPDLIIFDPLFCLHKADENSSKEMLPILMEFKKLTTHTAPKPAVILVHHMGKRGESSGGQISHQSRGSSALGDVPDATWLLNRTADNNVKRFSVEQRYGPPIEPIDIRFDYDEGKWHCLGQSKLETKGSARDLADIVAQYVEINRPVLCDLYCEQFNCEQRTFDSRLMKALKNGYIQKRQEGKTVFFSVIK